MFSISRIIGTAPFWLAAPALFCVMTAVAPDPAWAQTATKLNCKKCVKNRHVSKNTIKGNRLKDGIIDLDKLEPGLGERANATHPFYVTMDLDGERKTIVTHGPLTISAGCFIDEGGLDVIRIFATSSVNGWFTADNIVGTLDSGPFLAGTEIEMDSDSVATGVTDTSDPGGGDAVLAPGGYVADYAEDSITVAFNALGHVCTATGTINLIKGTP